MSLPQIDLKVIGDQLNHIHVDKGPYVLASCIAVAVLPAIAVALRFWARKIGKSEWRADDHFIVVALVCRWSEILPHGSQDCADLFRFFPSGCSLS